MMLWHSLIHIFHIIDTFSDFLIIHLYAFSSLPIHFTPHLFDPSLCNSFIQWTFYYTLYPFLLYLTSHSTSLSMTHPGSNTFGKALPTIPRVTNGLCHLLPLELGNGLNKILFIYHLDEISRLLFPYSWTPLRYFLVFQNHSHHVDLISPLFLSTNSYPMISTLFLDDPCYIINLLVSFTSPISIGHTLPFTQLWVPQPPHLLLLSSTAV